MSYKMQGIFVYLTHSYPREFEILNHLLQDGFKNWYDGQSNFKHKVLQKPQHFKNFG